MSARPSVSVFSCDGKNTGNNVALPDVFKAPIRSDAVTFVHTNLRKNSRQAYGISRQTGHRATAESWGTGRAVARIPRLGGGGTSRSGEGAYGNMCRGGRMFAPTKVYRRWHRRVNNKLKAFARVSAIAATAVPALVSARGHNIRKVREVPLVVADLEALNKTKDAKQALQKIRAYGDVARVKDTTSIRSGKGKWRNRRYVSRKGPLVVISQNDAAQGAFKNLPGVEVAIVTRLNLLKLAPGGHLGRFVIWSQAAFEKLNSVYGTYDAPRKSFRLPRAPVANPDTQSIITSDAVQAVLRPKRANVQVKKPSSNPLRNKKLQDKLSPYSKGARAQLKARQAAAAAGKPFPKRKSSAPKAQRQSSKKVVAKVQKSAKARADKIAAYRKKKAAAKAGKK